MFQEYCTIRIIIENDNENNKLEFIVSEIFQDYCTRKIVIENDNVSNKE